MRRVSPPFRRPRRADRGRGDGARDPAARWQFVLGRDIGEADARGRYSSARRPRAWRFSYDMLGEGARTEGRRRSLSRHASPARHRSHRPRRARVGTRPELGRRHLDQALGAVLAATRRAQRVRVLAVLVPRVGQLVELASALDLQPHPSTVSRLARALARGVRARLRRRLAASFPALAPASASRCRPYQTRALEVIDEVARIARAQARYEISVCRLCV